MSLWECIILQPDEVDRDYSNYINVLLPRRY